MSWLPLPYIQLESARTNGADYFDTQWNAGYGFSVQFAGCAFTDGAYLFGAMTSEDSTDKFALQFQDGKYIYHLGDQTAESPAEYELGEPHYFSIGVNSWSIDGVSMPYVSFSLSPSNEMTLPVCVGAVNVGGETQNLSDVQIGYIYFAGSSGTKIWHQCKTQDGQFGFVDETTFNLPEKLFVEKPDFTYGGVMVVSSSQQLTLVGAPTKTAYKLGEPFDPTGMTVYLNLDDGTQRDITNEVEAKYPDGSTEFRSDAIIQHGSLTYIYYKYKPVGVDYANFNFGSRIYSASFASLTYTVSADSPVESIEVTKLPDKTEYLIKEYFSTTGMVVTGHLANGESAEIGDSTNYSGVSYPLSTAGTFDVTVNWYDGSKYLYAEPFQITVKNGVEKLNITLPTKSEYSIGEKFNPTGITVTALYLDGTERPIYNFFVDSSKFDSTKEGGYAITVKATVDEKEYTETITVYVFGAPKKLDDLLGTTEGMTVIRNNSKNDSGKDTISGVDWFVFDGNTASKIYVSGDNYISFNNTTEHIKICRRDGATYYVYSQSGKLDDGRKFFKIRVEGYTYWSSATAQYALKYELFLFDDNSMFLNILQAPTNTSYLGTSELYYNLVTPTTAGMTKVPFTVEAGKEQEFHFLTSDPSKGKPWSVVSGKPKKLEELLDTTDGMTSLIDNVEAVEYQYEIDGAPWFVYDGKTCEDIRIQQCSRAIFGNSNIINFMVCNCGVGYGEFNYLYRQDGILDNGHMFLKIRAEGYSDQRHREESALRYELFLFDDGGMFLNAIQIPSSGSYLGESGLKWSGNALPVSFSPDKPKTVSFYTTDPAQGKPWTLAYYDYDFEKNSVRYLTATPTKRQYSIGDELDGKAFDVTAEWLDGRTEKVTDFTIDPSGFNSQKEGRYSVTVSAEIGGKAYTAETLVVVYGEPHSIYNLINAASGLQREEVYHSGITRAHIYGVPWFNFDGGTIENIEAVDSGNLFFTNGTDANFALWTRGIDNAARRVYGFQEGLLDNGHRFFKIRAEQTVENSQSLYELFFFDDNSIYVNLIKTSNDRYATDSFLQWSDGKIDIPVQYNEPLVASFYTTDPANGKPWTMEVAQHQFIKPVESISALATKREHDIGESFDSKGFSVTAHLADGTTACIENYTVDSSAFNNQKEGRYTVTVKATILGTEYTTNAVVMVYGEPYDILDLLNTSDGMESISSTSGTSDFGDVSWFNFDGKAIETIGLQSRNKIYINGNEALIVCKNNMSTDNRTYIQEGILKSGNKFFKLKSFGSSSDNYYAYFELFLFDNNSIYLNIISTPKIEAFLGQTKLTWSDGEIEIPVTFGEPQKASFYTDSQSEGKPWTMELGYHNFIKERMHKLTVVNGSGSGDYLEGETVTVTAEERENENFIGWTVSVEGLFGKASVKNYNVSGEVHGATVGNTLLYYYCTSTKEPAVYDGWDCIGTINGKDLDTDEQYNYFAHVYKRIAESESDSSMKLPNFELECAKDITLQDYTRQEAVIMSSGAKFTCAKKTDDLYLWIVFVHRYWSNQKWEATPDVATFIPENGSYNVLLSDDNVPAVQFAVQPTAYPSVPASMAGLLVEAYSEKDKMLKFTMPAEDVTLTANYSPKLGRIEITEKPFKLNYDLNEKFNRSGMVVTLYYADGTQKTIRDYTVSDFDSSTVGAKELTVSYTDGIDTVTATLTANVGVCGIVITKYPNKRMYKLSDVFDPDGLEVSLVYEDNSTHPTEDYRLSGFDSDTTGIKNITVTYTLGDEPESPVQAIASDIEHTFIGYNSLFNAQFSVPVTKTGVNLFSGYNEERTIRIHFLNGKYDDITGDEIEGESMSLTESLGNDKNLKFGGCISTQFSVNIFSKQFLSPDTFPEGDIEVYLEVGDESLKIFTGTIESAERTGSLSKRKIIAYDCLKRKGTIKLKAWYKSLKFPMELREFRDSLFEYVGIEQTEGRLNYDDSRVPDNMNVDSLTFLSLVKDICIATGRFGHINADGKFEYIKLKENGRENEQGTGYRYYTPEVEIPDENVISATFKEGKVWYPKWYWINPDPNYLADREEPSDVEAYEGNIYFIRNNYVIGDSDWIEKSYTRRTVSYDDIIQEDYLLKYMIIFGPRANSQSFIYLSREYSLTTPGNMLRKIGTNISFNCIKYLEDGTAITWTINSYIMSRTITGVRSLKDVYTAKNSAYNEEAYGAAKDLRDVTDAVKDIKDKMPKSTKEEDGDDGVTIDPFKGVETPSGDAESSKAKEEPNKLYVYQDGTARYNGTTISGSGSGGGGTGGGFDVQSVTALPSSPDPNTIYLIQGEVVVE